MQYVLPTKWPTIKQLASDMGAGSEAIRKWGERGRIPGAWKVKIFEASNGAISFADMEINGNEGTAA